MNDSQQFYSLSLVENENRAFSKQKISISLGSKNLPPDFKAGTLSRGARKLFAASHSFLLLLSLTLLMLPLFRIIF